MYFHSFLLVFTNTLYFLKILDDMEIAPDFFDYFQAGAMLLDSDK